MSRPDAQLPASPTGSQILLSPASGAANSALLQESGLAVSGSNQKILTGTVKPSVQTVAAGTASATVDAETPLVQVSTDGAQACTLNLPEAADNIGLEVWVHFVTDGGQDVTLTRAGADTLDEDADTGNTTFTLANAGETIGLKAVGDNIWAVIARIGGTLG